MLQVGSEVLNLLDVHLLVVQLHRLHQQLLIVNLLEEVAVADSYPAGAEPGLLQEVLPDSSLEGLEVVWAAHFHDDDDVCRKFLADRKSTLKPVDQLEAL